VCQGETFFNLAQLQYPKSATTIPKTFRKVTADNFPQWVFSGAEVAELCHTQSGLDPARHPFLTSAIPGLHSTLECRNLISSNSFAHRLGTGNSALRLAPGPVGLKPELRQGRSELIYKILWTNNCPQRTKPKQNRILGVQVSRPRKGG